MFLGFGPLEFISDIGEQCHSSTNWRKNMAELWVMKGIVKEEESDWNRENILGLVLGQIHSIGLKEIF